MTDRISPKLLLWVCVLAAIPLTGCGSGDANNPVATIADAANSKSTPGNFTPAQDAKPISAAKSAAADAQREQLVQHLEPAGQLPVSNPFFQGGITTPSQVPVIHLPRFDVAMSSTISKSPSVHATSPKFDPGLDLELNTPQQNHQPHADQVREHSGSTVRHSPTPTASTQRTATHVGRIRELPQRETPNLSEVETLPEDQSPLAVPTPANSANESFAQPSASLAEVDATLRPLPIGTEDVRQDLLKRLAQMHDRDGLASEANPLADSLDEFVPAASPLPAAISKRAYDLIVRGNGLAQRSAFFSAQEDFMEALRVVARGNDAMTENDREEHLIAVNQAFLALEEAEDFVTKTTISGQRLYRLIETHQTPALKGVPATELSTPLALDAYHRFAHKRLIQAAGREPIAAEAMVRLGKLKAELAKGATKNSLSSAKALLYYDVALAIQPGHAVAANELGVAMAKLGKIREAQQILASANGRRSQELDYNLAVVNRALGYPVSDRQLAQGPPPAIAVDMVSPADFGPQPARNQYIPNQPTVADTRPTRSPRSTSASPEQNSWWQVWRRSPESEPRR